jgi:hypothetical protein
MTIGNEHMIQDLTTEELEGLTTEELESAVGGSFHFAYFAPRPIPRSVTTLVSCYGIDPRTITGQ